MITLTLQAPGKNALSSELMTWRTDRLAEASEEPLLLAGTGEARLSAALAR